MTICPPFVHRVSILQKYDYYRFVLPRLALSLQFQFYKSTIITHRRGAENERRTRFQFYKSTIITELNFDGLGLNYVSILQKYDYYIDATSQAQASTSFNSTKVRLLLYGESPRYKINSAFQFYKSTIITVFAREVVPGDRVSILQKYDYYI